MCYATIAAITDYDCWYEAEEPVTVEMVVANLMKNADHAKRLLKDAVAGIVDAPGCPCRESLKYAIITQKDEIPAGVKKRLAPIIGKYVNV